MDTSAKSTPRDVFLYLFATVALYFSAGSIINLLFAHIEAGFPDPLEQYYDPSGTMRLSMALLIIIFPAYLWASRFLHRDLLANPEKNDIRVRKWLLYLTLFLAALLIIGDLVALIYSFLEGDLTVRFLLKIAVVLAVAGAVFWYYLYDLRAKASPLEPRALWFVRLVMGVVAVTVICGLFVAGSPFRQRLVRFDAQKVNDLQGVQSQVINYWQRKDVLPQTAEELRDDISGYVPPKDPQSAAAYEYRATGALSFELCAEFNLQFTEGDGATKPVYGPMGQRFAESWNHEAGRVCFSRTIDPELYRLEKSAPPAQ
ncbi:MAG: hypothetical protein RL681_815 [Candidatus Parcubacteria bacterium]|jgi:hypothetical protein